MRLQAVGFAEGQTACPTGSRTACCSGSWCAHFETPGMLPHRILSRCKAPGAVWSTAYCVMVQGASRAAARANVSKSLDWLQSVPSMASTHLWSVDEIVAAESAVLVGLLSDIYSCFGPKTSVKPRVRTPAKSVSNHNQCTPVNTASRQRQQQNSRKSVSRRSNSVTRKGSSQRRESSRSLPPTALTPRGSCCSGLDTCSCKVHRITSPSIVARRVRRTR